MANMKIPYVRPVNSKEYNAFMVWGIFKLPKSVQAKVYEHGHNGELIDIDTDTFEFKNITEARKHLGILTRLNPSPADPQNLIAIGYHLKVVPHVDQN